MDSIGDQQKQFLSTCKRNIEKMEKLVSTIMDIKQLEAGKIILNKETVNMTELLKDSVDSLKQWAQDKKINLVAEIPALDPIDIDPNRIYQVITNLVSNALKFTPADGKVEVRVKKGEGPLAEFLKISVTDTGIGIREKDLDRIFA